MRTADYISYIRQNESECIDGIYNYCDKWCEKCPFTSRCALYMMERVEEAASEDLPQHGSDENDKFWKEISDTLKRAMEILFNLSKEKGMDLKAIDAKSSTAEKETHTLKEQKTPLLELSRSYTERVKRWFVLYGDAFNHREMEFMKLYEIDTNSQKSAMLRDYREIIHWYSHQGYVKLKRAEIQKQMLGPDSDPVQNDMNGSAKVALIGYQRSMAAWVSMKDYIPESEDEILKLLVRLGKLTKEIEREFPHVTRFKRPGFDDLS